MPVGGFDQIFARVYQVHLLAEKKKNAKAKAAQAEKPESTKKCKSLWGVLNKILHLAGQCKEM